MPKPLKITNKQVFFQCNIVGLGANGSNFFREFTKDLNTYGLTRGMRQSGMAVDVNLIDKDRVEKKNLKNQVFAREDIGDYKVVSLAERYGEHYSIPIKYLTEYVTDLDMLANIFPHTFYHEDPKVEVIPVLISMVDNNKSRQLFHKFFYSSTIPNLIYIDAGVEGVLENESGSGFGGQVVVGFKWNHEVYLKPVGDVYRNILEDKQTAFPNESCAGLIDNHPQRAATNRMAAMITNNVVNNLLHSKTIYQHYVNFNGQFCGARPVFVPEEVIEAFEQNQKNDNK